MEERPPITARSEWVPHIETEPLSKLVKPTRENQAYAATLAELVNLPIAASQRLTAGLDIIPELERYKLWLDGINTSSLSELDNATLSARIESLATALASTPVDPITKAITLVADHAPAIIAGRKKASEVLDTEDTLGKLNRFLEDFDSSALISRLGHYKPNLRVLELGAGIGSATAGIVKHLTRPDGQVLFSQYVVFDPSLGRIAALKTRFQGLPNMSFEALDIGIDAEMQGFNEKDFDLIIAAGVLHSEPTSGEPQLGQIQPASAPTATVLDGSASYLLVGGLGGLGRSVAVWMVQHGARHLMFLSRSAGTTDRDGLFVEELQSMGCEVHLVRGNVTDAADVARAVAASPRPLRGIIQMTMVLHDQAWRKMNIDEWHGATAPKVRSTWNLHNETQALKLDFFILFSSLSGQANYASANMVLDAFVSFRPSKGLPCTSLNIGAVEGAGYLVQDEELLKKMKGTGWRAVQEAELLDVAGNRHAPVCCFIAGSAPAFSAEPRQPGPGPRRHCARRSAQQPRQQRQATQRRPHVGVPQHSQPGQGRFLNAAKASPETLSKPESALLLAQEVGKKLLGLVLRTADNEIDVSLSLSQLGLDSMVAVEMRAWWKQIFGLDISVLHGDARGAGQARGGVAGAVWLKGLVMKCRGISCISLAFILVRARSVNLVIYSPYGVCG